MKIFKPDGTPLNAPSVNFQFTTLASNGTCVLYVEQFNNISAAGSDGLVILNLGSGTQAYSGYGSSYTDIFNNSGKLMNCQGSGGYLSATSDRRRLIVQFNDNSGTGWQSLPVVDINSVPYSNFAEDSEKFSGKILTDFILSSTLPASPCTGSQVLTYSGGSFSCVAAGGAGTVTSVSSANSYLSIATGTTTPVITANVGTTANTLAAGNDSRITGALQKTNNLSDLASAATARTNLGLGSAATLDAGTAASNLVQLDGSAKIPVAFIPSLPGSIITSGTVAAAQLGSGTPSATTFLRGDGAWTSTSSMGFVLKTGDTMTGALINNTNSASTALAVTQSGSGYAAYFTGGNVGVGTNAPSAALQVTGKTVASGTAPSALTVVGGTSNDSFFGFGGGVSLTGGVATFGGVGGTISLTGGNGYHSGGAVTLNGGQGVTFGIGHGGDLNLFSGGGKSAAGNINLATGTVAGQVNGGNISIAASAGSNVGGNIVITAGDGPSTGGNVTIDAGGASATAKGVTTIGGANALNVILATGGGKVGVGTSTPSAKLEVQGQIVAKPYDNGAATTFDLSNGNSQYTTASCGAITLQNMVDGGNYAIAIQGGTSGTCTFTDSAGGRTFRFSPANAATTAGTHTVYTMQVMGTTVYVNWVTGY